MKLRMVRSSLAGFSRSDLVFTLGTLALIFLCTTVSVFSTGDPLLLPASSRARAKRLACLANLRELGAGYHRWATDHGDRNPMHVEPAEGGIRGHFLGPNAWFQFATLSNELSTARILACPADSNTVRVATDFSSSPTGGLQYIGYRNNAVSYFVGLHAFFYEPRSILSGDHNVPADAATGCSYALTTVARSLDVRTNPSLGWLGSVHMFEGNLLFNDGSAQETTTLQLRAALNHPWPDDVNPRIHLFLPK